MPIISGISDLAILRTIQKYSLTVNNLDDLQELIQNIYTAEVN
ncbi:hypothetical protein [Dolichospermum sp. UHCC 0259]|nr:hypothetical protein [Dolichospermum sp. UHCC 0259]